MIAQRSFARILRSAVIVEPQVLLRRVGKEAGKYLSGGQVRIEIFSFGRHAQGIVFAADLDAFAAAFAKVRDEDREEAALAGSFLFNRAENRRNIRVGQRQQIYNARKL